MQIAILGSTGFVGQILLRILLNHPDVEHIYPVSSSNAGRQVFEHDRGLSTVHAQKLSNSDGCYLDTAGLHTMAKLDLVFSALPHLKSAKIAAAFVDKAVLIDLSLDFRIPDPEYFAKSYEPHPRPDLLSQAVYGLSELMQEKISTSDLIANPGCYPTASLIPLIPLAPFLDGPVIVNALSGISGAGRSAREDLMYTQRTENVTAYSPGQSHRHWGEMSYQFASISEIRGQTLYFTPHLVPMHHGMAVTSTAPLKAGISDEHIQQCFEQYYGNSPFIRLCRDIPESSQVRGTNRCDFTWHREGRHVFLFSVIDNLYKGAAGQAVQNMNIRFDLGEVTGLDFHGEI